MYLSCKHHHIMGKTTKKITNTADTATANDNSYSRSSSNDGNGNLKVRRKRKRKSEPRDSPARRSSAYRGVTRHRWTGRFEAHLWDKNGWNVSRSKKGRQVYIGAYDDEDAAARAHDLAALKYWGQDTHLNFPLSAYREELEEMESLSREEYIGSLRRKSSGFSRGVSKYRGVARHHHNGRWEARIGRVFGNKYLYLGTYATQEEAATAYDVAAIEHRGLNAVTNFDLRRYIKWLPPVVATVATVNASKTESMSSFEESVGGYITSGDEMCSSTTSTSPLQIPPPDILVQSPVFKDAKWAPPTSNDSSPSPVLESSSSDARPLMTTRCSFPDDVQTFFEAQVGDEDYDDEYDSIFGDLGSISPTFFHFEHGVET